MKKINVLSILTIFALLFFNACGGGGAKEEAATTEPETKTEEVQAAPATDIEAQMTLGKSIYDVKCVVCHQADAKGLKGAFPPLAGSDYLLQDPKRGIHQTLNGSNEKMVVNGETYIAPMTPQVQTREEALAVINYVLKHFNGYSDDKLLKMEEIMDIEINPMKIQQ